MTTSSLLDLAVHRVPLESHDGRSGALLERVLLEDGTKLVVKRTSPAVDLVMRLTGEAVSREYRLWRAGVLDRLPEGVAHAIVGGWREGDETVLAMRDVGDAVVGWRRRLSRREWRRLLAAATSLHRAFQGAVVDGLCPLVKRISIFASSRMSAERDSRNSLPRLVVRGWERFAELVAADVAQVVFDVLDRPERIAEPLSRRPSTLIHGDLWLVNVAFEAEQVTLLDWDLATWAPPALELSSFVAGNASRVDAGRDELVDDFRATWGDDHDEVALRLALFAGLLELGWNKALDAAEHPDATVRAQERTDLEWWVAQARRTLESGLIEC